MLRKSSSSARRARRVAQRSPRQMILLSPDEEAVDVSPRPPVQILVPLPVTSAAAPPVPLTKCIKCRNGFPSSDTEIVPPAICPIEGGPDCQCPACLLELVRIRSAGKMSKYCPACQLKVGSGTDKQCFVGNTTKIRTLKMKISMFMICFTMVFLIGIVSFALWNNEQSTVSQDSADLKDNVDQGYKDGGPTRSNLLDPELYDENPAQYISTPNAFYHTRKRYAHDGLNDNPEETDYNGYNDSVKSNVEGEDDYGESRLTTGPFYDAQSAAAGKPDFDFVKDGPDMNEETGEVDYYQTDENQDTDSDNVQTEHDEADDFGVSEAANVPDFDFVEDGPDMNEQTGEVDYYQTDENQDTDIAYVQTEHDEADDFGEAANVPDFDFVEDGPDMNEQTGEVDYYQTDENQDTDSDNVQTEHDEADDFGVSEAGNVPDFYFMEDGPDMNELTGEVDYYQTDDNQDPDSDNVQTEHDEADDFRVSEAANVPDFDFVEDGPDMNEVTGEVDYDQTDENQDPDCDNEHTEHDEGDDFGTANDVPAHDCRKKKPNYPPPFDYESTEAEAKEYFRRFVPFEKANEPFAGRFGATDISDDVGDTDISDVVSDIDMSEYLSDVEYKRKWRIFDSKPNAYASADVRPHPDSPSIEHDDDKNEEYSSSSESLKECIGNLVPDREIDLYNVDCEGTSMFSNERKWYCLINSLPSLGLPKTKGVVVKVGRSMSRPEASRLNRLLDAKQRVQRDASARANKNYLRTSRLAKERKARSLKEQGLADENADNVEVMPGQDYDDSFYEHEMNATSEELLWTVPDAYKVHNVAAKVPVKRKEHAGDSVKARRTCRERKVPNNKKNKCKKRKIEYLLNKKKRQCKHDCEACKLQPALKNTDRHSAKKRTPEKTLSHDHDGKKENCECGDQTNPSQCTCTAAKITGKHGHCKRIVNGVCKAWTIQQPYPPRPMPQNDPRDDFPDYTIGATLWQKPIGRLGGEYTAEEWRAFLDLKNGLSDYVPTPNPWRKGPSTKLLQLDRPDAVEEVYMNHIFVSQEPVFTTPNPYQQKCVPLNFLNYKRKRHPQCRAKLGDNASGKVEHGMQLERYSHSVASPQKVEVGVRKDAVGRVTERSVGHTSHKAKKNLERKNTASSESVVSTNSLFGEADRERVEEEEIRIWRSADEDELDMRRAQGVLMNSHMDWRVDPCDNFYNFACGSWPKHHPLPKDKGNFDTFEILRETLDVALRDVLMSPMRHPEIHSTPDDAWIKATDLYASCINYDIVEKRGAQPLLDLLTELGGWPIVQPEWDESAFDWVLLVADLRLYNNDILLAEWVGPDLKHADEYIVQFDQTTLGLPNRDHFLLDTNKKFLDAYAQFITEVVILLGATPEAAAKDVQEIILFEKTLAVIIEECEHRKSVETVYARTSVKKLRKILPGINFHAYLEKILRRHVKTSEHVVVYAIPYFQQLCELVDVTEKRIVSNYILWRFVRHRVSNLDNRFIQARQNFYKVFVGREEAPQRWRACVAQVNSNMGMALGAMFVDKYFDESSKEDTMYMVTSLVDAFRDIIENMDWISQKTKTTAVGKLDAMVMRIGYPDFAVNTDKLNCRYNDVKIERDKYFENTLSILTHLMKMEHDRLGHTVNKTYWSTAPALVNAYYSRNKNQIIFPAGILQPPFYHKLFPKSLNYGGIGVVIGHEITHGYDDKGRLFDSKGDMCQWWNNKEIEGFQARAKCLIEQYSEFIVDDINEHVNGFVTQGENIADNGGIKQAYDAYQHWLETHDEEDETLPGLNITNNQLFFLNFAQIWCGVTRPEAAITRLKGAHAPGKFRVLGTLANSVEFSAAFGCPLGSPMNPEQKCMVW